MIAVLSTLAFNPHAPVVLKLREQPKHELLRRVTREPTLDGGCAIQDFGYSESDRSYRLLVDATVDEAGLLGWLCMGLDRLTLSIADGVFAGVVDQLVNQGGAVEFVFHIERRL